MLPFFEGIIAAIGALIVELSPPIFGLILTENSLFFLFFAASSEEIIKYAFIYNHFTKLKTKERILSGSILIGLGFACIDIILKQLSYDKSVLLPVIGVFLVHLFTAALLGLFLRKNISKPIALSILILVLNILIHFSYNLLILRMN